MSRKNRSPDLSWCHIWPWDRDGWSPWDNFPFRFVKNPPKKTKKKKNTRTHKNKHTHKKKKTHTHTKINTHKKKNTHKNLTEFKCPIEKDLTKSHHFYDTKCWCKSCFHWQFPVKFFRVKSMNLWYQKKAWLAWSADCRIILSSLQRLHFKVGITPKEALVGLVQAIPSSGMTPILILKPVFA